MNSAMKEKEREREREKTSNFCGGAAGTAGWKEASGVMPLKKAKVRFRKSRRVIPVTAANHLDRQITS